MPKGVTLAEIAKAMGVHSSTVSRALQHDPQIPLATAERVAEMARRLGYQPNSNARAMAFRRWTTRPVAEHGALAALIAKSKRKDFERSAIRSCCQEMGYQIEVFHYPDAQTSGHRLTQILKSRGIAGILIWPPGPKVRRLKRIKLDWSPFPAVLQGNNLFWPVLHRVADNQFRNARILVRKLSSLGYRRIGLFVEAEWIRDPDNGWLGGYLAETQLRKMTPSLYFRELDQYEPAAIREWIRKDRLDVVIADHEYSAARIAEFADQRIPAELGVASLFAGQDGFSGIDARFTQIEKTAVEFLVHLIHSHQRGVPEVPQRVLVEGIWFEGRTTRRLN